MSNKLKSYFFIGITAFLTEYIAFVLIYSAGVNLIAAQTASFMLGLTVSFLGNRNITFKLKQSDGYVLSAKAQLFRYLILALTNLVLTNVLIYVFVSILLIEPVFAKVIVMALVVIWNYLIFNRIIFKSY